MVSAGRQRGRPKKVDSLRNNAASSTGTRRTTRNALDELSIPHSKASTASIASSSDLPSPSMIGDYMAKDASQAARHSLSSVSTHDQNESSGYSTPATSAVATPITESISIPIVTRRRRPANMLANSGVSLVAKAAAIRNSQYSLSNKRKRVPDSEDDADEENTADAQLARALQEQEDAAAAVGAGGMDMMDLDCSFPVSKLRRSTRKVQKILPKTDFVLSDSDEEPPSRVIAKKKPAVELSAKGSNSVTFGSKKTKKTTVVTDSDDPLTMSKPQYRNAEVSRSESEAFKNSPSRRRSMPSTSPMRSSPKTVLKRESALKRELTQISTATSNSTASQTPIIRESDSGSELDLFSEPFDGNSSSEEEDILPAVSSIPPRPAARLGSPHVYNRVGVLEERYNRRGRLERARLEAHHSELNTMWQTLEDLPKIGSVKIEQPKNINRELKPFQLEGVAWMIEMEKTDWGGGLLGDEMGMGKTIQAVSLIMSDFPASQPSLVLIPPVALMQWQQEIEAYTDGTLKTLVYHGTNAQTKGITVKDLKKYNVILMSYNSLESMYRKQEKGFKRKNGIYKEKSIIHQIQFHRVILDEAHNIKQRTTGSAKACFALKADHKWCLSGTPLQNRISEFFSLIRFLDIKPFACYFCKQCKCSNLNWEMNLDGRCNCCGHSGMQHVSVFNQELLNPIQKYGNVGPGKEAFRKLRILTDRFMLRRVKRDHSSAMELPAKEIYVDRQFFGEEENDFAGSIMNNGTRKFETYVAQGVLLNNYANIFGLIMQMRQVADHPDLILKRNSQGGQNVIVCCICDETAEEAIRSSCRHEFCRECAKNYLRASENPDCPRCHIPLSIDLEQPEIEQDEQQVKKSSIINRIKMENWTSSSKIEVLVHDLWKLRSKNRSHKSIIFSQFTTMLQLVEWRLRRAGITTVMLDGSMTPAQRQASIRHFMTDVNVECFLVSLKAGGVALNLTEASHVFIIDPWWNPAAEWQSADRCHRIGQARPCTITRLCIEDSVESRMVLLQEKKANMINSTINADQAAMESLTTEDMQFLFRGN